MRRGSASSALCSTRTIRRGVSRPFLAWFCDGRRHPRHSIRFPDTSSICRRVSFSQIGLQHRRAHLNTFQPNTTYMASDVFSKAAGKHTWKFGGEFRYLQVNERNYASPNGQFTFDGTVTGSRCGGLPPRRDLRILWSCLHPGCQAGSWIPERATAGPSRRIPGR